MGVAVNLIAFRSQHSELMDLDTRQEQSQLGRRKIESKIMVMDCVPLSNRIVGSETMGRFLRCERHCYFASKTVKKNEQDTIHLLEGLLSCGDLSYFFSTATV